MTSLRTRERLVTRLRDKGIVNDSVLEVILNTPRHLFVEEALAHQAYDDTALPIGHGQTISQPWVVARMTELLLVGGGLGRVLEVGTGCGYQAAILSALAGDVYSVERIRPLWQQAQKRLTELHLSNVHLKHADGSLGWPEQAPFDGIIAACARADVPRELLAQLADGGRLVMPIAEGGRQWLMLVSRQGQDFTQTRMEEVKFVPFMRGTQ
jgi:protein-L-isoaspartate(D-aspartate) O-methyltransferase